jgi:hypothetical protein
MELDAWSYADEEWRGFVLIDSRDELLDRHVFVTLVAGESFYPDALGHADFAPRSPLVLRHEPDNPFARTRWASGTRTRHSRSATSRR